MSLQVIGLGVGRTGTLSMKTALELLGFGPCHHMEEVDATDAETVARWQGLAEGRGDLAGAYHGFAAAVDWPTAAFAGELVAAFPQARFLLTRRDPEVWYASFSETIYPLLQKTEDIPPELLPFIHMVKTLLAKTGFALPASKEETLASYHRHLAHVRSVVPEGRLLEFEVSEGWGALCRFLEVPVPEVPFPRTNSRKEFWESFEKDAGG